MRLEEVCEFIIDAEHKTAPFQKHGHPNIRTPNIGKGRLILESVFRVSEETYQKWTKRAVPQSNDLILAREAPVGNVAIIPENELVCLGQRTVLLRPDTHKTNPHFLCYFLLSDKIQNLMLGKSGGSTVAHLNMKDIRALELGELPPLPTQQKIASILSAYDDLIENNLKRIRLLEEAAQNLYREWFVKFRFPGWEEVRMVDGLPEGWKVKKLGDVALIEWGDTSVTKAKYTETGYNAYSASGCDGKLSYFDFNRTGIVLSAIGAYAGLTWFALGKWSAIKNTLRFWSKDEYMTDEYLFLATHNINYWMRRGSAQPFIALGDARNQVLITPTTNVLTDFSQKVRALFLQIDLLKKQTQKLKEARDILLPRLMNQTIEV